jgi:hypothetical protein
MPEVERYRLMKKPEITILRDTVPLKGRHNENQMQIKGWINLLGAASILRILSIERMASLLEGRERVEGAPSLPLPQFIVHGAMCYGGASYSVYSTF